MGKIYDNVLQLIGNTPMLHLNKIEQAEGLKAHLYAKVEGLNPGGSVKDRAALNMIEAAEAEGKLKPGGRIVEGTSGNTGIGIALVSAVKKYRATICMQEGSSKKIRIIRKRMKSIRDRKSGKHWTGRWIFLWRLSAPAGLLSEPDDT